MLEDNSCTCSNIPDGALDRGCRLTDIQFAVADIENDTSQKVLSPKSSRGYIEDKITVTLCFRAMEIPRIQCSMT